MNTITFWKYPSIWRESSALLITLPVVSHKKEPQSLWNMDSTSENALREKCPNTEFFLVHIFQCSVRTQENKGQRKLGICTLLTQWWLTNSSFFQSIFGRIVFQSTSEYSWPHLPFTCALKAAKISKKKKNNNNNNNHYDNNNKTKKMKNK